MWLKAEGISWPANVKRPQALQDSWLGPFRVLEGNEAEDNVGNITLELPPSLSRLEHVSKLEPFIENNPEEFPGRAQEVRLTKTNNQGEFLGLGSEIESILDQKWERG